MKTEYGKAWVELRAGLGYPVDIPTHPLHIGAHDVGDARDWRWAKCAAEHENASYEVSEEDNSEKPTENIDSEKVINKTKEN